MIEERFESVELRKLTPSSANWVTAFVVKSVPILLVSDSDSHISSRLRTLYA